MRAHPHATAAALIALFVVALLWPALIGIKILSPTAITYEYAPWRSSAPRDLLSYFNFLLSDVPMADYPWRWLARDLLHRGTFPAWNPHNFAGVPLFNNPQVGLFSPFNLPLWILPLNYALGLSAAIKLWAGGFGAYVLVRQLRLGFLPGLLAAVSFAFCSLNIVWLTHETLPSVAVALPWALWLVERLLTGGRLPAALGLGAVVATGIGGGHPGMQVHLLAAIVVYAMLRAAVLRGPGVRERLRRLSVIAAAIALGVLVMGVMIVPELLSSRGTLGTLARSAGSSSLPGADMPFDAIRTVVVPDWWGRPGATEVGAALDTAAATVNYNERTFYAGVVALLFALVALVSRGRWRGKAPFLVLGVLGLAIPLHAPGLFWLVSHLPAFELVQNQRMHFIFSLAVAVLGAFGLESVVRAPRERRLRLLVPAAAIVLAVATVVELKPSPDVLEGLWKHFSTGADLTAETAVAPTSVAGRVITLTSVAWLLLFALGVGAALLAARLWPRRRRAIAAAVVLLAAADMFHFAYGYQPMGEESKVVPPVTPAVRFLQARAGKGRVHGIQYALINDYSLVYGIDDIRGYDPPQPTIRFYDLWRAANPAQSNWQSFSIDEMTPEAINVISVLGARYVIADNSIDLQRGAGADVFIPAYLGGDAAIFLNRRAAPRVMVPRRILLAYSSAEAIATIVGPDFDPRTTVVAEVEGTDAMAPGEMQPARGDARLVEDRNARVTIAAELDAPGLVVLNDNLTDGWSVTVDGAEADVVRVNSVMRGVMVDAGSHEIVWSYEVPGLRLGAVLTAVGLLGFAAGGAVLAIRRRRRRQLAVASAAPR